MKWRSKISTPDVIKSFLQEIQGVAAVVAVDDQEIVVEFEGNDEFELGRTVSELERTLGILTMESITITRPKAQ